MEKKISTLQLSGLTIGPILGSGIILLPPMAYASMGPSVIYLWIAIMAIGALFAFVFAGLSLKYPGDGGVMNAIEVAFGNNAKTLSSLFLMAAVTSGPVAVLYTCSMYVQKIIGSSVYILTAGFVVFAFILLQMQLRSIGNISFAISSMIALLMVVTSVIVISEKGVFVGRLDALEMVDSLKMLMLLFWAIIGWEIIGVYSDSVENPESTIPKSTLISVIVISFIYIIVALSFQSLGPSVDFLDLLRPVFGGFSEGILAVLVTGLCVCTYLLVVGAATRLLYGFAKQGMFPEIFGKVDSRNNPIYSISVYTGIHLVMVLLLSLGVLELELLLSIANGFFIANAWIGVLAAFKVLDSSWLKMGSVILLICFTVLFFTLHWSMIGIVFLMSVYILRKDATKKALPENS